MNNLVFKYVLEILPQFVVVHFFKNIKDNHYLSNVYLNYNSKELYGEEDNNESQILLDKLLQVARYNLSDILLEEMDESIQNFKIRSEVDSFFDNVCAELENQQNFENYLERNEEGWKQQEAYDIWYNEY